jgi:glutamate-1-semialdehyde 2,1-aminomutase
MSQTMLRNADLDTALAEAREAYVARNPASLARHRDAVSVMPGGNTRTVLFYDPFPAVMVRGEGCRLWDLDGHSYIDFLGEYTAGLYGHSEPVIRAAIEQALGAGLNLGAHGLAEASFARAICERFPSIERVRFTNSGTEANLMALATAAAHTRRRGVLAFRGAYHGGVLTFAAGVSPINVPYDFVLAPYNDIQATLALIERHAEELAAIIVEPMMGSGGCIPARPDFLQALRKEATRVGAVLILDEVMTSRLAPAGLQSVVGIRADLTTLGKYAGGGMSFGAFGGREELMELYDPRRPGALPHAGTFNNNVLTMAAGLAGLTRVYTPSACEALNARGERLRARLNDLAKAEGAPMQVTGIGSMMTVHFTARPIASPADAAAGDPRLKELFFFDMLEHGIWLARRGMINLSLPMGDSECDSLVDAVQEFLTCRRSVLAGFNEPS